MPIRQDEQIETRQRLLEAGGEIFAQRGFQASTIREICQRAGANVAAVNYHFGDKERLYLAVLRHAHQCAVGSATEQIAAIAHLPAEERLARFIAGFLHNLFGQGAPAWHARLMAREMADPTEALEMLIEQDIRPRALHVAGTVRELLGPHASQHDVEFCTRSVVGQMLFYFHGRPVIARLFPAFQYTPKDVQQIAEHVTRFSLAAIRGYRSGKLPRHKGPS